MPIPHPACIVRFLMASILAIALWYVIRAPLVSVEASIVNQVLQHSVLRKTDIFVKESELHLRVRHVSGKGKKDTTQTYRKGNKYGTTWSSIFFVALCLCMPFRYLRRRWPYLIAARVLLLITQCASLVLLVARHPAVSPGVHGRSLLRPEAMMCRRLVFWICMNLLLILPFVPFLPVLGDLINNGLPPIDERH